jgi:hypothetical protein
LKYYDHAGEELLTVALLSRSMVSWTGQKYESNAVKAVSGGSMRNQVLWATLNVSLKICETFGVKTKMLGRLVSLTQRLAMYSME